MRLLMLLVCGLAFLSSVGCATSEGMTLFKNRDYNDPTEGPDDPWISNVGSETKTRGVRKGEKSEEPRWMREVLMSDRAREIESNLGITD
jgi:hypothetical protein